MHFILFMEQPECHGGTGTLRGAQEGAEEQEGILCIQ